MVVRSLITFDVREGMNEEFERIYREGEFIERARVVPGFLGGEFVCIDRDAGRYAATALWDSAESYRRWQELAPIETPREWRKALADTLTEFKPGVAWEIISRVDGVPT